MAARNACPAVVILEGIGPIQTHDERLFKDKRPPAGHFVSSFLKSFDQPLFDTLKPYEKSIGLAWTYTYFHKFVAAPVLRGGGLYGSDQKIGFEMRQWDFPSVGVPALSRRSGHLVASLQDLAESMSSSANLTKYAKYGEVKVLSGDLRSRVSELAGKTLEQDALVGLEERIRKAVYAMPYTKRDDMEVVDPGIRFLYPLRDWAAHPAWTNKSAAEQKKAKQQLNAATKAYAQLYAQLAASKTEGDALLMALRIGLARWAKESGLVALFAVP